MALAENVELLQKLHEYESRKRTIDDEQQMIANAVRQAINETVQRIASVIINERRAEIEAACNFGELRDALAAELARQFMAMRLMGQPVPGDTKPTHPAYSAAGISSGQATAQVAKQRIIQQLQQSGALGKVTP